MNVFAVLDVDRIGLSRERRGVHQDAIGDQGPVNRHHLARPDPNDVTGREGFERHRRRWRIVRFPVHLPRLFWTQAHQPVQGIGGLETGTRFQPIPEQKEGHNEGGTVDEDHAVTKVVAGKGCENDRHAPQIGRAGTK